MYETVQIVGLIIALLTVRLFFLSWNLVGNFIFRGFVAGILAEVAIDMMAQDAVGLESYISYVREGWLNLSPMVGAALLVGVLFYLVYKTQLEVKAVVEKTGSRRQ